MFNSLSKKHLSSSCKILFIYFKKGIIKAVVMNCMVYLIEFVLPGTTFLDYNMSH